jgi:ABC-type glycerol-3-phosphate transport system substrate-binding protein
MKRYYLIIVLCLGLWGCEQPIEPAQAPLPEQLTVWTAQNIGFWEAMAKEFDVERDDILLDIQVESFPTQAELQLSLINALAEGTGPDIVVTDSDWIIKNTKKLTPINDSSVLNNEKFREDFYPVTHHLIHENTIWGIPIGVETIALFYNKALFTEAIDGESILQQGATWKQILEFTQQITKTDNSFSGFSLSGFALGRSDNINHGRDVLQNMILQKTKNLYASGFNEYIFASQQEQISSDSKINHGQTAAEVFFAFTNSESAVYSWNELSISAKGMKDFEAFVNQDVGGVFGYARDVQTIQGLIHAQESENKSTLSELNFEVAPFPRFSDEENMIIGKVTALAVPHSAENKNLAWNFLTFVARKESQRSAFLSTNIPSARQDLFQEQQSIDWYGVFVRQIMNAFPLIHPLPNANVEMGFEQYIQEVNDNKTEILPGLEDIQNKLNDQIEASI